MKRPVHATLCARSTRTRHTGKCGSPEEASRTSAPATRLGRTVFVAAKRGTSGLSLWERLGDIRKASTTTSCDCQLASGQAPDSLIRADVSQGKLSLDSLR